MKTVGEQTSQLQALTCEREGMRNYHSTNTVPTKQTHTFFFGFSVEGF